MTLEMTKRLTMILIFGKRTKNLASEEHELLRKRGRSKLDSKFTCDII